MTRARTPAAPQAQRSAPRRVSQPHDHDEREAVRAADVVARGGSVAGWSFSTLPVSAAAPVQRQEAAGPKPEDEKYKEAAIKAGEAALATPQGQALKEKVLADPLVRTVKDAVTSPAGIATTAAAAAGGVAALAATGKELPFQPPAIPLDKITPGLSAKVTYEGPVSAPTFVGLTLTYKEQAPKGKGSKQTATEKQREENARLAAEQAAFRRGLRFTPGSKEAEEQKLTEDAIAYVVAQQSKVPGLTFPLTPAEPKKEEKQPATPAQPAPASPSAASPVHAHVDAAVSTSGRPLDPSTRRSMEARFGYDFSGVRVHDDARAAATAASIDAAAFTVGEDVVFGPGRHDPSSPDGRRLLAHELVHVVQQSRPRGRGAPGPGKPLDERQRAYFEPRLGADFSSVRIHADEDAAESASAHRARAYTTGSDVVFGKGQYSPDTPRGRWLLAHELAHVAQAGRPAGVAGTRAVERDASAAATDVATGRPARIRARRRASDVHLFGEPDNVPNLTFVSQSGEPGFLNQAVQFHRTWGLAPQRFATMHDLLATLAQDTGAIPRLRIVSHANFDNIFTPLFPGGAAGITEEDLIAFGESDVAGLRRRLGGHLVDAATSGQVLAAARTANAAALRPFGLDQPNSAPAGVVEQLVLSSIDLLVVRAATGIPQNQRATLDAALTAELAGLRTQVQAAAPTGAGVTAAQAQALETALTSVTGFTFTLPAQPGQFITGVQTATAALAQGFRANLDAVRARLSSSSWIDIRGCRVGQRPAYLAAVAQFFGTGTARPNVSGPDWFQSYPTLGLQTVQESRIRTQAADSDVQAALAHWSEVTGIRRRLMWWLRFLSSVLREEAARAATPGALVPPSLSGGLTLQLDPFLLPDLEGPLPPLRPLEGPSLFRPQPSPLGGAALRNPFVDVAQREIPRYTAPDGELRYYLDAGLPLPVQRAANVQNIFLLIKAGSERQAVDAWLNSQWEPAAPGLAALQAGSALRGEQRQVEAVSELDARRRTIAMFVSPDPRYAEHIKTT